MKRGELGTYGYDGACRPDGGGTPYSSMATFSLGIFRWVQAGSRNHTKRGPVIVRVKGDVSNHEAVVAEAERVVRELDADTYTGPKTVVVKGVRK